MELMSAWACQKKVSHGGSHVDIQFFTLACSYFGSQMPNSISPGVNMPQDQHRVCVGLRKRKKVSPCLTSVCLKLSRSIAALTSWFCFSTEYVLSVQCFVRCLGKHLCDSLGFLDVSNACSATKKKKSFWCFVTECLRRWCLFLMPFEHSPSGSQTSVFIMQIFLGMKIKPHCLLLSKMELLLMTLHFIIDWYSLLQFLGVLSEG